MSPRPTPLLKRLRRHRGLWALVVAVLFIKLLGGSLCVADGGQRDARTSGLHAAIAVTVDATPATPSGDGDCLLGEGASCHCACAHASTLPSSVAISIQAPIASFATFPADVGRVPGVTGSLLRPPIA